MSFTTRVINSEPHEDIDNEDLMSTNVFVPVLDTRDLEESEKEQFKRYYTNFQSSKETRKVIDSVKEEDSYSFFAGTPTSKNKGGIIKKDSHDIKKIERLSIIDVDTRNRDKNLYPDASHFILPLGKTFYNIKRVELVSTAIPNTDQVITDKPIQLRNNIISWQNLEDVDLGIYTNAVIESNVTNYVDITITNHGLSSQKRQGDFYVTLTNSTSTPSVDGQRYITIVDSDTIRFAFKGGIAATATVNVDTGFPTYTVELTPGNYNATSISTEIQYQLNLVKRRNQASVIFHYFTVETSLDTDVMTFRSYITKQLSNNPLSTTSGTGVVTVSSSNHGFKSGDYVLIIGAKNLGGITSNVLNGLYTVEVLSSDVFTYEVNERASEGADGGGATVKTGNPSEFRLVFDTSDSLIVNHIGFPDEDSGEPLGTSETPISTKAIIPEDIQQISQDYMEITATNHGLFESSSYTISSIDISGPEAVAITTTPHNLNLKRRAYIEFANSEPVLDGFYSIEAFGDTSFFIKQITIESISAGTGILRHGGDEIKLYNFKSTPNIDSITYLIENITNNTFQIKQSTSYIQNDSIEETVIGTNQIFIRHPSHGFNIIESITAIDAETSLVTTKVDHGLNGVKYNSAPYDTTITNTVDIIVTNHGLATSDTVLISNSSGTDINGTYIVQVIDIDTFRIEYIGGVNTPGTCSVNVGDTTVFNGTNSNPSIDTNFFGNTKYYVDVISATEFRIDTGFLITTPGTSGILGRDLNIALHRVEADTPGGNTIGGIPLTYLNHNYHYIENIIDSDNYMIRVDEFSRSTVSAGSSNSVVTSQRHGYRVFQSNTYDGTENGVLYRSISLEGENYLYLISHGLQTVYSPGNEKLGDVFAKLLLSEPPGVMIFDGFISAPLDFNPPLASLKNLTFDFKRQDGYLFNFNNTDLSFSIRVTEIVDTIDGTGFSSRTGTSDIY